MGIFGRGRRSRRADMRPFDGGALDSPKPTTLAHALDEGLLIADYAVRMAVRNRMMTELLTTDSAFDASHFAGVAAEVVLRLADEADASEARIVREQAWAEVQDGRAEHTHDYRTADTLNLRRREALAKATAAALRERAADTEYLAGIVEESRLDAWRELSGVVEETVRIQSVGVDDTGKPQRLDALRRDLAALRRARTVRKRRR
ncbi:hypothetical protein ASE16_01925 [Leifsonia sp. Root227]|uniref:hypothetical protein n=1 Tax=Leifsonia sp. Root227 TaxID=1736496 RepID=UPI0006F33971|nr:hypothetical protein [Leifsonia sp. Root227]KRC51850.1 hypothetical protein ASE16_01925 [Leifsonia sp. Root227]